MKKGSIFIITGPTCSGKTVISEYILKQRKNTVRAVSITTRSPREGEVDGKDYFFVSIKKFEDMIKSDMFIEYCKVYDHYYGTTKDSFSPVNKGLDVIKVIDVQGAIKIKNLGINAVFFFFAPKNFSIIKKRLLSERSDSDNKTRLETYKEEIVYKNKFDYYIDTSGGSSEKSIKGCSKKVMKIMDGIS